MKRLHRLGPNLNAFRFTFDDKLLEELRNLYAHSLAGGLSAPQNGFLLEGAAPLDIVINSSGHSFNLKSYGKSPLLWISSNDQHTYDIFRRFCDALEIGEDIKKLVDYRNDLVMYCGFFVVGNRLHQENSHVDYYEGSNAYTFITPLFEPDAAHGDLLFKDEHGQTGKYRYRLSEAVVLGERFHHSTECYGPVDRMRVLVSFTIGTDKPEYWGIMKQTIGTQSKFMYLPCGHRKGACGCIVT